MRHHGKWDQPPELAEARSAELERATERGAGAASLLLGGTLGIQCH